MLLEKVSSWWRRLPQKTRVQLIALVLLVFAGTEVLVLAPFIFDIALMIDVGGFIVLVAILRSSVSVSLMQLRPYTMVITKPFFVIQRAGEMVADYGLVLSEKWYFRIPLLDRRATRLCEAVLSVVIGLLLVKLLFVLAI